MITCSGKCSATSLTKSHSPPLAAIFSTEARAITRMRSSSFFRFCGMNQAWVSARYLWWSGASMWIRVRSRCGLPPIISRTFLSTA